MVQEALDKWVHTTAIFIDLTSLWCIES
jgi:hypothetical protein